MLLPVASGKADIKAVAAYPDVGWVSDGGDVAGWRLLEPSRGYGTAHRWPGPARWVFYVLNIVSPSSPIVRG